MNTVWIIVVYNILHQYQYTVSGPDGKWLTFADKQMALNAQSQHPPQFGFWSECKEIAVMANDPAIVTVK